MAENDGSKKKPARVKPMYRGTRIVWYIAIILEVLLGLRFLLKLLAANPAAGFTMFIYGVTTPFVAPFLSVFKITTVQGSVFEWTTLLAMLIYWLIAWAITKLLLIGRPVTRDEAAKKMDEQD